MPEGADRASETERRRRGGGERRCDPERLPARPADRMGAPSRRAGGRNDSGIRPAVRDRAAAMSTAAAAAAPVDAVGEGREGADSQGEDENQRRGAEGADPAVAHDLEAPLAASRRRSCRRCRRDHPRAGRRSMSVMAATDERGGRARAETETQGERKRKRRTEAPMANPASGNHGGQTRRKSGAHAASVSNGSGGTGRREKNRTAWARSHEPPLPCGCRSAPAPVDLI